MMFMISGLEPEISLTKSKEKKKKKGVSQLYPEDASDFVFSYPELKLLLTNSIERLLIHELQHTKVSGCI